MDFYADERVKKLSCPPSAFSLLIFLLTGPHTTQIPGIYEVGRMALAERLHWSSEDFNRCFREISDQGIAEADWDARVVYIKNRIAQNPPEDTDTIMRWRPTWRRIPECELKNKAYFNMKDFLSTQAPSLLKAFMQSIPPPFVDQNSVFLEPCLTPEEPKKKKIQKQLMEILDEPSKTNPTDFDKFWKQYPWKVKKPYALKMWNEKQIKHFLDEILEDLSQRCWKNGCISVPHASTYLNNYRWHDEQKVCPTCQKLKPQETLQQRVDREIEEERKLMEEKGNEDN